MNSAIPTCEAADRPMAGYVRVASACLLVVLSLVQFVLAARMVAGLYTLANLVFLLCTLVILSAATVSVRYADKRSLSVVQGAAAAALLMLFWTAGSKAHDGPSVTFGRSTYELTLTFAGLLFSIMLLARWIGRPPAEQACRCG